MAIWDRLTALIAGGALSRSAGTALDPVFETTRQRAQHERAVKVLDPNTAASVRARETTSDVPGIDLEGVNLQDDAQRHGVGVHRFDLLTELARTEPDAASLLILRRRGIATNDSQGITEPEYRELMRRHGYEAQWIDALHQLAQERLAPAQIALGIVRTLLGSQGLLVGEHDTTGGVVPSTPISTIDAVAEAEAMGIDEERLRVLVGEIGLPMSLQQAASAYFRGIIKHPDFYLAVAQGDTRPAWADAILEQARAILSPNQYAELQLRGFLSETQRRDKTAQYGMHDGDSDLLYDLLGRSIPVHQITTGEARGGVYNGDFSAVPEAYLSSLRRGNLRPEFYSLAYANRYSYPSAFFFRLLLTTGAITAAEAEQAFLDIGWSPHWASLVSTALAKQAPTSGDPHVAKAETQLWTTLHRSFVARETGVTAARPVLTTLGIDRTDQDTILNLWQAERDLTRKQLTAAQIKKAWVKVGKNDLTGQPWTTDEAIAALVAQGYSVEGARQYLDVPPSPGV